MINIDMVFHMREYLHFYLGKKKEYLHFMHMVTIHMYMAARYVDNMSFSFRNYFTGNNILTH